jgi:hypothetical protein
MTISEAESRASEIDQSLLATDPRFERAVKVIHVEGTNLLFMHAFAVRWHDWYLIFTEHHRFFVYHEDDVEIIQFERRMKIEEVE